MDQVALATAPGSAMFVLGNVISISGTKGSSDILQTSGFTITNAATADINSGSTVGEYMEWIQAQCGINTTLAAEPTAGVTLSANGEIVVTSNFGPGNALTDLKYVADSGGSSITSSNTVEADGVSETTAFRAYDSLGGPVDITLTYVLVNKSDTGNTWRFYATSGDDTDNPVIGTGTVKFDTSGRYLESTDTSITINRAGTGAIDPVIIDLNMQQITGSQKASGQESSIQTLSQDGYPTGTLNDFAISSNGEILGSFSNGLTRTLGQIVLGSFSNNAGLIEAGDNTYIEGPNSGRVAIVTPGDLGTGTLIGGALELSNVDITSEFVDMITATTAFSASGRVITTSQQLLTELLQMVR
jgi:flagellar hook protein FlgE